MTPLLSTADAARAVGIGSSTVKRWADAGLLQCVRTAGGHRRFALADVERMARAGADELALVGVLLDGRPYDVEAQLLGARARLGSWHAVADALGPVIVELGRLWRAGRLSVLEEHMASERLARALAAAGEALPLPRDAPRCLLACVEGDDHTLGLSLVELTLREAGWMPLWSGRATPAAELVKRLERRDLRLVALSASSYSRERRRLEREARRIAVACRTVGASLVLGGTGGWPEAIRRRRPARQLRRAARAPRGAAMKPRLGVPAVLSAAALRLGDALAPFVERVPVGPGESPKSTSAAVDGVLDDGLAADHRLSMLFTSARLQEALAGAPSPGVLVAAHAAHKYLYLAHDPAAYRALGRLVANSGRLPLAELVACYRAGAAAALASPATPGKHANVLEHILGFFKRDLAAADKRAMLALIDDYRRGRASLAAAQAPLHALAAADPAGWVARQVYWEPYPRALGAVACA